MHSTHSFTNTLSSFFLRYYQLLIYMSIPSCQLNYPLFSPFPGEFEHTKGHEGIDAIPQGTFTSGGSTSCCPSSSTTTWGTPSWTGASDGSICSCCFLLRKDLWLTERPSRQVQALHRFLYKTNATQRDVILRIMWHSFSRFFYWLINRTRDIPSGVWIRRDTTRGRPNRKLCRFT